MTTFNTTMFDSIKEALQSGEQKNNTYNEILQFKPGNTYTVRLLPNTKDIKNTFFHFFNHGWVSFATGQYVQALSPQTFGERDPIAEERYKIYRTGTVEEKEKVKNIRRIEKWLVNAYIVDDPTNPDNNGKVKILRYGKQLQKIITEAIEGEDADEFGPRIFDLGPDGVNFKIKVEEQGEYPTYVSSRFTTAGKLMLSAEEQDNIYNSVFDLTSVFTLKSYDELKGMLEEHYYVRINDTDDNQNRNQQQTITPTDHKTVSLEPTTVSNTVDAVDAVDEDIDIDELLKDL